MALALHVIQQPSMTKQKKVPKTADRLEIEDKKRHHQKEEEEEENEEKLFELDNSIQSPFKLPK